MDLTVNILVEHDNVSSGNGLLGLLHNDEGGRSGESRENAEGEDDEVLGEHVDDAGNVDKNVLKFEGKRAGELH